LDDLVEEISVPTNTTVPLVGDQPDNLTCPITKESREQFFYGEVQANTKRLTVSPFRDEVTDLARELTVRV